MIKEPQNARAIVEIVRWKPCTKQSETVKEFAEDEEVFLISTLFELIIGTEKLSRDTRHKLKRIGR
jgi:hypothetical protein